MMRVADYIADYIYKLGVKEVFMVSGGGMMFLSDGIAKHPFLKAICNHHEQASAMAAVSYAKYLENFGVAFVTTGCGGTNAMTGLLGAWQDNIPCIFISGQTKRKETIRNSGLPLRQFGVQEADIVRVVESLTKYAVMVIDPQKIAYHLDKAVFMAKSGRPGPVWLDIPLDVQGTIIDENTLERFKENKTNKEYKEDPTEYELRQVEKLLTPSKRPIIIAGQGVRLAKAIPQFKAFVEKYKVPFVATRLGVNLLPTDHPLFIGRIGNKGDRAGNFALQNADLVISIGSRLSVSSTGHEYDKVAREANIVVVDIDPIEHKKNTIKIDLFINADVKNFLTGFNIKRFPETCEWAEKCLDWKTKWSVFLPEYAEEKRGINLYYFVDRLSKKMKPGSVVISDAGSALFVVSQAIQLTDGQRYITSGGQGEMGYTIPATIGVSIARGRREVFGITGDGSFQMNIQELQTIVHHDLPVKIFVWNNSGYLSIRATQSKFFVGKFVGADKGSGVSFPPLRKIAAAYGIKYFKVSKSKKLDQLIDKVLAFPKAVICEVICLKDQEIVSVSSYKREDGTIISRPLEDLYPFLDREEFLSNMIVKPLEEK